MMAARIAPGMERNFAATSWKNIIDRQLWYDTYDEARAIADSVDMEELKKTVDIQGFDIDPEVLHAARYNAERAGVNELIHFQERDVRELSHPKKYGFIITNPPYGERLEEKEDMPPIYTALGERYALLDSWSMYLITGYELSLIHISEPTRPY